MWKNWGAERLNNLSKFKSPWTQKHSLRLQIQGSLNPTKACQLCLLKNQISGGSRKRVGWGMCWTLVMVACGLTNGSLNQSWALFEHCFWYFCLDTLSLHLLQVGNCFWPLDNVYVVPTIPWSPQRGGRQHLRLCLAHYGSSVGVCWMNDTRALELDRPESQSWLWNLLSMWQ